MIQNNNSLEEFLKLQSIKDSSGATILQVEAFKGDRGDKGEKGDQGDIGPPGSGPQGIPGTAVAKGDRGDSGSIGSKGDRGDKGDKGDTGAAGTSAIITSGSITFDKWSNNSCSNGQVPKYNSTDGIWECGNDGGGSSYLAGTGLTLSGSTFGLNINGLSTISSISMDDYLSVYDVSTSSNSKISRNDFLAPVLGALNYQGTWNASGSTAPELCNTTNKGHYFVVSTAGNGYSLNDWAVCNGSAWDKLVSTSTVASVFGRTGVIIPSSGDYTASQIGNTATGNVSSTNIQNAINELDSEKQPLNTLLTGIAGLTPASGNFLVGNGTVFTTENGNTVRSSLGLGVGDTPVFTGININGDNITDFTGSGLTVNSGSLQVSIVDANNTRTGLLNATDWSTFNNKENAVTTGTSNQYYRGDKTWATLDKNAVNIISVADLDVPSFSSNAGRFLTVNSSSNGLIWTNGLTTSLSNGKILIGNGSDLATAVAVSGDATLSNTGALIIAADAVELGTDTTGNYVASIANGIGISGGTSSGSEGTILTLSLNINGLTGSSTIASDDYVPMYDTSASSTVKVSRTDFLSGVMGSLNYQGTWNNSSTSTPETCNVTNKGHYWVATVDNQNSFSNKDWAICNGASWEKLANSNNVTSVFGRTGAIVSGNGDYTASQIGSTSAGNIAATNIQDAINELDNEKLGKTGGKLTDLDVPSYSGNSGKMLVVNSNSNGVEWASALTSILAENSIFIGDNTGQAVSMAVDTHTLSVGVSGLALNLTNANTWAATQTFGNALVAPTSSNTLNGLIVNTGSLSGITGLAFTSGNFDQSASAGTFKTGTGAVSINGNASITTGKTLTLSDMTSGSVLFAGASGVISQNNSGLYFNSASNRLGIGTASPAYALDVVGNIRAGGNILMNGYYLSQDGDNEGVYVNSGGYVGIGTGSPSAPLHVTASRSNSSTSTDKNNYVAYINNTSTSGYASGLIVNIYTGTPGSNNQYLEFVSGSSATSERGSIEGNGGGINVYSASDSRLKENIVSTGLSLEDLMKIHVRDFDWIESGVHASGFIAQELYLAYPMAVDKGDDDVTISKLWKVDYSKLTPLLVKAIQDQQSEIESLQVSMNDLKNENGITFKNKAEFRGPAIFKSISQFIDKAIFKEDVTLEKQLCFQKEDNSTICLDSKKMEKLVNLLPTDMSPSPTSVPSLSTVPANEPTIIPSSSPTAQPTTEPTVEPTTDPSPSIIPTETPINN